MLINNSVKSINLSFNQTDIIESCLLETCVQDCFDKIFSFFCFDEKTVIATYLTSKELKKKVSSSIKFTESNLVKNFKINSSKILNIENVFNQKPIIFQQFSNLLLTNNDAALKIKAVFIKIIATLDVETINHLKGQEDDEQNFCFLFIKDIFDLYIENKEMSNEVEIAQFDKKYLEVENIEKFSLLLIQIGKIEEAVEITKLIFNKNRDDFILRNIVKALIKVGCFKEAIEVALLIPDKKTKQYLLKIYLLRDIFSPLKASEKIEEMLELTKLIIHEQSNESALNEVCEALIQKGNFEKAEELAMKISNKQIQDELFEMICKGLIQKDNFKKAEELAMEVSKEYRKDTVFEMICKGLIQKDNFERAEELAMEVSKEYRKDKVFEMICKGLIQKGNFERAEELAMKISNKYKQKSLFSMIHQAFLKSRKIEEA